MRRQVTECPSCDSPLRITELSCTRCETRLQGEFPAAPLARLSAEHQRFIETFVRCRGIIRDVERALGVSYPTVRARLDSAVAALGETMIGGSDAASVAAPVESSARRDARRRDVLRQVETGSLDAAAAAEILRDL